MTFISKVKQGAINGWHSHQILPSISIAQAILESASGTSSLAAKYYNLFGIKASADWTGKVIKLPTREHGGGGSYQTNADFRWYDNWNDSMLDHSAFFTNTAWRVENYKHVVGEKDYKKAAQALQNAGYATDPQYATKLIARVEQNNLTQYDTEAFNGKPSNAGIVKKTVGGTLTELAKSAIKQYNVTLIGDSLGVGTQPKLAGAFKSFSHDALGSRQITHATNSLNGTYVLQSLKDYGQLKDIVVVILGTNRGATDTEIDNFVAIAGSSRKVIFVDTNSQVGHRQSVSDAYKRASERHNNVYSANWMQHSNNLRSRYYGSDNIHMTGEGYQAHADFIKMAVYETGVGVKTSPVTGSGVTNTEHIGIESLVYDEDGITSPLGESVIYNHPANELWGNKVGDKVIWVESILEVESDDPQFILESAVKVMKKNGQPAAQYVVDLAELPDDVSIGDWGYVLDHEFNPPLYIHARVLEIITSETDLNGNKAVIGNVTEVFPADKSDIKLIQSELKDVRENLVRDYRNGQPMLMLVDSTNGMTLGDKYTETELVVKITQGAEDLTDRFIKYTWERVSNDSASDDAYNAILETESTNRLIVTSKDIVNNLSTFVARVYEDEILINQSTITIKHVDTALWTDTNTPPTDAKDGAIWVDESGKQKVKVDGEWEEVVDQAQLSSVRSDVEGAITEAEEAKQAAQEAYTDAIAEAERLVVETDTIWQGKMDDYDEQVALIGDSATSAQTKADQALTDVGISTDLAQTAKDLATTAQANSGNAITQAGEAMTEVGKALSSADTAKTNAQTALDNAQTALTEAGGAKTTVNELTTRVDDVEGEIELKASQTTVDGISGTISDHSTTILQHATQLSSKAESSLVDTIKGTVDTHTTDIRQNATDISSKASATSVDTLSGTVSEQSTLISQNATDISARLTSAQVNSLVNGKGFATGTYVDNQITATSESFGVELTKVEGKIPTSVGGSNLVKGGNVNYNSLQDQVAEWDLLDTFDEGEEVTVSFRARSGMYTSSYSFYYGGGSIFLGTISSDGGWEYQTKHLTFKWKNKGPAGQNPLINRLILFNHPIGNNHAMQVDWIVLTRGDMGVSQYTPPLSELVMQDEYTLFKSNMTLTNSNFDLSLNRIENKIPSLAGYAKTGDITTAILADKQVKDTRFFDHPPSWYYTNYPRQVIRELKDLITVGVTGYTSLYGLMETDTPWGDVSGGYVRQTLQTNSSMLQRRGAGETWGPWTEVADTTYVNTTISATADGITQMITKVKNNPEENIVGYNTVKNTVNSMEQAIGSDGGKIAQMVMTNSLFQTTVLESVEPGGRNLLQNTENFSVNTPPTYTTDGNFQIVPGQIRVGRVDKESHIVFRLTRDIQYGEKITVSYRMLPWHPSTSIARFGIGYSNIGPWTEPTGGTGKEYKFEMTVTAGEGATEANYKPNREFWMVIKYTFGIVEGSLMIESGNLASNWTPAPEDKANQSQVTQLAGSWALTLKSGGDIKTQINATTNAIRLKADLIHLSGNSLIDNATIKSAHIETLNANKIVGNTADFNTVRAGVLTAGAVTSTHITSDNALIDKLFATSALIDRLTSKTAFISQLKAIDLVADKASFLEAAWTALNSRVTIDGAKIRLANTAGDFAEMNNIPEFRSQDAAGTAAILGKGRSHYYSANMARFYIGTSLEGSATHGVHIAKGQSWGIYRNSDSYGGSPAEYYTVASGQGAVQVIEDLMVQGKISSNFNTAAAHIRNLNGWPTSYWPVLQPGQQVLYKEAVPGNSSGVERIWTMGTSSGGSTRVYSHVHHVFEGGTTGSSDERLKHDIAPTLVTALDHIDALTFKEFKWNKDNLFEPLGLIAQHSGILRVQSGAGEMEGIDIQRAIMLALKGIQELQEEIKNLKESK